MGKFKVSTEPPTTSPESIMHRVLLSLLAAFAISVVANASATATATDETHSDAAALKARHASLQAQLADNDFKRPLHIESAQSARGASGDVYALVQHPFNSFQSELKQAASWCDILILHTNIKQCLSGADANGAAVGVRVGRKSDQPLADTYRLDFQYRVLAASDDYLRVQLYAERGPVGTHDYRISLAAVALDSQHSFIHISYSYAQGLAARLATRGYLATAGSSKVGFSVIGRETNGRPIFVRQMRGIVERNAMRYYLAVEAFLGALTAPQTQRSEKRLRDWYQATQQYARQLQDLGQDEYLKMKRDEVARQNNSQRQS